MTSLKIPHDDRKMRLGDELPRCIFPFTPGNAKPDNFLYLVQRYDDLLEEAYSLWRDSRADAAQQDERSKFVARALNMAERTITYWLEFVDEDAPLVQRAMDMLRFMRVREERRGIKLPPFQFKLHGLESKLEQRQLEEARARRIAAGRERTAAVSVEAAPQPSSMDQHAAALAALGITL